MLLERQGPTRSRGFPASAAHRSVPALQQPSIRSRGFPASAGHRDVSRLKRFGLEGDCYHVTAAIRGRRPLLADSRNAEILLTALNFVRAERAHILAFAIMPDHFHALLVPRPPQTLSMVMQAIKGYSARRINEGMGTKGSLWRQGFHDRFIRDEEQLRTTAMYIEQNPVAAGIIDRAEAYQWSSAYSEALTDVEAWLGG